MAISKRGKKTHIFSCSLVAVSRQIKSGTIQKNYISAETKSRIRELQNPVSFMNILFIRGFYNTNRYQLSVWDRESISLSLAVSLPLAGLWMLIHYIGIRIHLRATSRTRRTPSEEWPQNRYLPFREFSFFRRLIFMRNLKLAAMNLHFVSITQHPEDKVSAEVPQSHHVLEFVDTRKDRLTAENSRV